MSRGRRSIGHEGYLLLRRIRQSPSRRVNRSLRASADYEAFVDELRSNLNPRGPLERLAADHVAQAAWRLKATLDRQADRDPATEGEGEPPKRLTPSVADRSARSFREAVETFDYLRNRPGPPATIPIFPPEDGTIASVCPDLDDLELPEPEAEPEDNAEIWRDRLVFDFEISESSPIVKGTWITVGHVVSEIVDGSAWAEILRTHPELTEDDIRACLAYAIADEG